MATKYVTAEAAVDLDEWSDDELIAELRSRGAYQEDLRQIYDQLRLGKKHAYEQLERWVCDKVGKVCI